ncbi:MAG: choice-of-anchor tandem repeat GloVer-containing protein [Candidatus Sulfotelmatobacter sp.]
MPTRTSFSLSIATFAILIFTLFALSARVAAQDGENIYYEFSTTGEIGYAPIAGITFDGSGEVWGATTLGGFNNVGTIFKINNAHGGRWSDAVPVHSFAGGPKDGADPWGGVSLTRTDPFSGPYYAWGTTYAGGAHGAGIVYELIPPASGSGYTEKVLHSFNPGTGDGGTPANSVVLDASGNVYGTAVTGGSHDGGIVFELSPSSGGTWTETILHSFDNNGTDGANPYSALTFDGAGNLYGTTANGGSSGCGIVFELTPGSSGAPWTETILHSFSNSTSDGCTPYAGIAVDGFATYYGTTNRGGAYGYGTIYSLSQSGGVWTESVLHSFSGVDDGAYPGYGTPTVSYFGYPRGTTIGGGSSLGTIYYTGEGVGGAFTEYDWHSFENNGSDGYTPYGALATDVFGNPYGTTSAGGAGGGGIIYGMTKF